MLQSEMEAMSPLSLAKRGLYSSSADINLSFLGITIVTQIITHRVQGPMTLEALLTAPHMAFLVKGFDP